MCSAWFIVVCVVHSCGMWCIVALFMVMMCTVLLYVLFMVVMCIAWFIVVCVVHGCDV